MGQKGAHALLLACLTLLILVPLACVGEAHASLAVEAHVGVEQITVKLELHDISQALYQRMLNARPALNETTIPEAILAYMEEEGLEDVYYKDPELSFDNASRTVKACLLYTSPSPRDRG